MSKQYWYETYGDQKCRICGVLLTPEEKGHFCDRHASDILMGVGGIHYPTPEDFIKEAKERGVSKRVGKFPIDVKSGISRGFLIHNTTKEVFAFFLITGVEVIVKDGGKLSAELQRLGVRPIEISIEEVEPERGCGMRDAGSAYVVCYKLSNADMQRVIQEIEGLDLDMDIKGPLVVLKKPIPWKELNYTIRGFLYVDGRKILAREPPVKWKWV